MCAPQMRLDLNLSAQLVLNTSFQQLRLFDRFDGHDELRLALSGQVHITELAATQGLANLEIAQRPTTSG